MLSHACARCGLPLDHASRSYLRELRLVAATCPRCGFATAWNPRRAREGARIWVRLRALNVRLGIAVSAGQAAAVLLVVAVAIILPSSPLVGVSATSVVLTACAAMLASLSAATIAPFRPVLARVLGAWVLVILPTACAVGCVLMPSVASDADGVLRRLREAAALWPIALAAFIASLAFAYAVAPMLALFARIHARRLRSVRRESIAFASGARP